MTLSLIQGQVTSVKEKNRQSSEDRENDGNGWEGKASLIPQCMDGDRDKWREKSTSLLKRKSVLGRGNRMCKGPEVAARLSCWENNRGAMQRGRHTGLAGHTKDSGFCLQCDEKRA